MLFLKNYTTRLKLPGLRNGLQTKNRKTLQEPKKKLRGPDKKIGTCFMLETIRKEDAITILDQLPTQTLQVEIGIYQLLCEYPNAIKA